MTQGFSLPKYRISLKLSGQSVLPIILQTKMRFYIKKILKDTWKLLLRSDYVII